MSNIFYNQADYYDDDNRKMMILLLRNYSLEFPTFIIRNWLFFYFKKEYYTNICVSYYYYYIKFSISINVLCATYFWFWVKIKIMKKKYIKKYWADESKYKNYQSFFINQFLYIS